MARERRPQHELEAELADPHDMAVDLPSPSKGSHSPRRSWRWTLMSMCCLMAACTLFVRLRLRDPPVLLPCVPADELLSLVRPTILDAGGYQQPGFMVWGGSVVRGRDGRHHMFASRWPEALGHGAWISSSEVVRAESVDGGAAGPYRFAEVVLPRRGLRFWDGMTTHNPHVHYDEVRGQYVLFYIGTTYTFAPPRHEAFTNRSQYESAWNGKRIGVATAPSPTGPWARADAPVIEPRAGLWDGGITSNPSAVFLPNGSVLLFYKSIKRRYPERTAKKDAFYIGLAASHDGPRGPFVRVHDGPIRHDLGPAQPPPAAAATGGGGRGGGRGGGSGAQSAREWQGGLRSVPLEDPYVWRCGRTLHMLAKTMGKVRRLGLEMGELVYSHAAATHGDAALRNWSTPVQAYRRRQLRLAPGAEVPTDAAHADAAHADAHADADAKDADASEDDATDATTAEAISRAPRPFSAERLERPQLLFGGADGRVPSHGFFALLQLRNGTSRNVVMPFAPPPAMPSCGMARARVEVEMKPFDCTP